MQTLTLDQALTDFLTALQARNTSVLTQEVYATDVQQFISWFGETSVLSQEIGSVTKTGLIEYLAYLASLGRSGVTRARKLASLREFFSYLQKQERIAVSPAASVATP
jgi:site-specific recombinase XerD